MRRIAPLLAVLLAACGSDGGGTGTVVEPVATVTVAGAPSTHVLAGSTVQLTATAASAAGAALPGRAVTWHSGDTTVATVSSSGLVSVVGAGSVTVTARSEGKEGAATLDARAGGQLGADGGTLDLLGGKIRLSVPAGSLFNPTTLLFRPAASPPANPAPVPGTAWELGPSTFYFSSGALLTLAYDPAKLPAGVQEASLQLYALNNGAWELVRGSRVDPATRTVAGPIDRWGTFAVAGTSARSVELAGPFVSGALYVGQTRALSAVVLDAFGDTLRNRVVTWSSSEPGRAAVDAAGKVTGQSAGPATITASVDGIQASTTVTVLPRPVASWGQAAEWSTLQGNARHDGHVAATLDPAVFRELWVKQLPDSDLLRTVVTGAGAVFVTTGRFGPPQALIAFDAASGAERWTRALPSVDFMGSPAFGNGRVYVVTATGQQPSLWSVDAADGAVRFTTPFDDPVLPISTPVIEGSGVYTGGLSVHRFDAASGAESYAVPLPGGTGSPPAVAGGRVLTYGEGASGGGGLRVLNAADGTPAYILDGIQPANRIPVLGGDGNLVAGNALRLSSIRLSGGAAAWTQPGSFLSPPAVGGGVVYAAKGREMVAIREGDGSVLWTWPLPFGDPWGAPLVTDNLLFVTITVNRFEGPGGSVQRLFTYAIDLATGKQVWDYAGGGSLALGAGGTLFISSPDDRLIAIAVK